MKTKKGISGIAFIAIATVIISIVFAIFKFGGGNSVNAGKNIKTDTAQILIDIDTLNSTELIYFDRKGKHASSVAVLFDKNGVAEQDAYATKIMKSDDTKFEKEETTTGSYLKTNNVKVFIKPTYLIGDKPADAIDSYKLYVDATGYSSDADVLAELEENLCVQFKAKFGPSRVSCGVKSTVDSLYNTANSTIEVSTTTIGNDGDGFLTAEVLEH